MGKKRIRTKNKTVPNDASVSEFIAGIEHAGRREDATALVEIMSDISGEDPVMWGPSIIGFGQYHYVYESGREGDMPIVGFSPRKANMVLYVMPGFEPFEKELAKLGRHRTGASCLYLGRLANVDLKVLREIIKKSVRLTKKNQS